jgi:HD-like signal output (HDOD) protein
MESAHEEKGLLLLSSMEVPGSIQRIEPFPACALALLNRIPPRPGDLQQVGILLEEEPLLVSEIGQVAVAAGRYGSDSPLDLAPMLEQIGASDLMRIAVTLLVRGYLRRALSVFEAQRYWRYTLACAVSCEEIALPGQDNKLVSYLAGLLHDIGRLALIAAYPDKYANLLALIDRMFRENSGFDLLSHERLLFGMDHFAAGSWLAASWGLPPWLCAITGRFNEDASGEYRELVTTVRSGTRLAHSLGFGYLQAAPRAEIEEVLRQLPAAWQHWQSLDQWKHAEEHMRGKIQSKLGLYAPEVSEDE